MPQKATFCAFSLSDFISCCFSLFHINFSISFSTAENFILASGNVATALSVCLWCAAIRVLSCLFSRPFHTLNFFFHLLLFCLSLPVYTSIFPSSSFPPLLLFHLFPGLSSLPAFSISGGPVTGQGSVIAAGVQTT